MRLLSPLVVLVVIGLTVQAAPQRQAGSATVEFVIDMRGPISKGWFDPATERVGVRGNTAPLTWAASRLAHDADRDGRYTVVVVFPARELGTLVSYKFKAEGAQNPNGGWEGGPNRPLVLDRSRIVASRDFDGEPIPFPHSLTGDVRLHAKFPSILVASRDVWVFLPDGYDRDSSRRFPVVYMHDGQNLFDMATSSGAEWRVDETATQLIRRRETEPVIVVGIQSLPESRFDDYTPVRGAFGQGADRREAGGRADHYGRFLVEELKPFVDRTYRTKTSSYDTGLGGSSLGGLVTMYLGLKYPTVFGKLMVVSPSVWWGNEHIVREVQAISSRPDSRIWLDIGTSEGAEAVEGARKLRDVLSAKGWRLGRDLTYVEEKDAGHDERAWADRFGAMLRFLFPARVTSRRRGS
jgi:predicted alpha/beta superfamily hydrolase